MCICLAVCGQLYVIPFLRRICLSLKRLFTCRVQLLPSIADEFGDLCKGQVLVLNLFSDLVGKNDIGGGRPLRCIVVGLGVTPILPLRFSGRTRGAFSGRYWGGSTLSSLAAFRRSFLGRGSEDSFVRDATIVSDCTLKLLFRSQLQKRYVYQA